MLLPVKKSCGIETATFGAGCFWCVEAIFEQLQGVIKVIPGYCGGNSKDPNYYTVCSGASGHAEVCQIIYDVEIVSFDELLEVFWLIHDPTSLNRQHHDEGSHYRSVIFYHNEYQKIAIEEYVKLISESGCFNKDLVTEVKPYDGFYPAEKYHHNYFQKNPSDPYSVHVILPKMLLFKSVFRDKLKLSYSSDNQ